MFFRRTLPLWFILCAWPSCEAQDTWGNKATGQTYGGALIFNCSAPAGGTSGSPDAPRGAGGDAFASAGESAAGTPGVDAPGPRFVPGDVATRPPAPLDCGTNGVVIENAGPPGNRVNYVILGDGYDAGASELFRDHIGFAMARRFHDPLGQPYGRYRKFVNICALQAVSASNGIGNGPTPLGCTGNDVTRLAHCDTAAAEAFLDEHLPESFEVDWHAIVLNSSRSWGTGAAWILWSGARSDASAVALHEAGHGHHQLADEYVEEEVDCGEYEEVNSTADPVTTDGKWTHWLGYDAAEATGVQCLFQGSARCRYGDSQFRSSQDSIMRTAVGAAPTTSFNAVSREKMIMDIWRIVRPIDSVEPEASIVSNPTTLKLNLVDPDVISVDWSVDGNVIAVNGGPSYDVAKSGLPRGIHSVVARAYDNADDTWVRARNGCSDTKHCWNRNAWKNSEQSRTWTLIVP